MEMESRIFTWLTVLVKISFIDRPATSNSRILLIRPGLGVEMAGDGWLAARAYGEARDSFAQAVYAHTSPIYIGSGLPGETKVKEAASFFARGIEAASENIRRSGRFARDEQREEVLHLFEEGRKVYARLLI